MPTTKPSKQRKMMYTAPLTERYRRFSVPLSSKLKESHNTSSVPVRKGDTVMVMRGDRKGSEGKVNQIDRKNYRIFVEGATREKVDGTSVPLAVHPSKVMITRLNLDDKWRKRALERKSVTEKTEEVKEKPAKKVAKKKTTKVTKQTGGT
ncbi:MAG: 50S ribosomal protein L24 [Candidatus Bathyarchaeia archaeon]|jgi:large subunit ribosomal protein L24